MVESQDPEGFIRVLIMVAKVVGADDSVVEMLETVAAFAMGGFSGYSSGNSRVKSKRAPCEAIMAAILA